MTKKVNLKFSMWLKLFKKYRHRIKAIGDYSLNVCDLWLPIIPFPEQGCREICMYPLSAIIPVSFKTLCAVNPSHVEIISPEAEEPPLHVFKGHEVASCLPQHSTKESLLHSTEWKLSIIQNKHLTSTNRVEPPHWPSRFSSQDLM